MRPKFNYGDKFDSYQPLPLYQQLEPSQKAFVRSLAFHYRLTFQEFRQILEIQRDLMMWGEKGLEEWGHGLVDEDKKRFLARLQRHSSNLKSQATVYPQEKEWKPQKRTSLPVLSVQTDKKIDGLCPVASPETVCCNLRTIDAVERCPFGCSYCSIQTFYSDAYTFDKEFTEKIKKIKLDPNRFYHYGTGQSSDSLVWGNRHGVLSALFDFAAAHPKILLELKTKSDNIQYLLENDVPQNIVCSWSLNPERLIQNEEHFTASLEQRLTAARKLADQGIRVAFHFHPMIYYQEWESEYPELARRVLSLFSPQEVAFISFGTLTFIQPTIQMIRKLGNRTKVLQMDMVSDPHGKQTYPDEIKIKLYQKFYDAFGAWTKQVFFYLCMEKASIWKDVFGYSYANNEEFEKEFSRI